MADDARSPYAADKILMHLDRVEQLREGRARPVELQLVISDLCNHDCSWCAYRASEGHSSELFVTDETRNPNRMIPTAKVREIVRDFAVLGGRSIIWTGGGEPTVHPDHMKLIGEALDQGLKCAINTNGALLRPGWRDVLPRMTYVRVSVDAGTPEEYARVRSVPPATYDRVLGHLAQMAEAFEPTGTTLGCGYVVMPEGYGTVVEGVRRLRDCGVDYVRLGVVQSQAGYAPYAETFDQVRAACSEAAALSTDGFAVHDLTAAYLTDLGNPRPAYERCRFQELVVYIGGDQRVYRCCSTAYTPRGLIGDLTHRSLTDWWFARDGGEAAYAPEFDARSCEFCQWNARNEAINAVVDANPLHPDFL